jgi:hypothetical protein
MSAIGQCARRCFIAHSWFVARKKLQKRQCSEALLISLHSLTPDRIRVKHPGPFFFERNISPHYKKRYLQQSFSRKCVTLYVISDIPTSGGRSVGIVSSRTQATELGNWLTSLWIRLRFEDVATWLVLPASQGPTQLTSQRVLCIVPLSLQSACVQPLATPARCGAQLMATTSPWVVYVVLISASALEFLVAK